jgi:hypothetical protein
MKLEHLIKGYKSKEINAELKEKNKPVSILKFTDYIYADCYESEDVVTSVQIISDTKVKDQIQHCTDIIKVIASTIDLQTNLLEDERNVVINSLGLYDGSFVKGKTYITETHIFKAYIMSSVLIVLISENQNDSNIPPSKSTH